MTTWRKISDEKPPKGDPFLAIRKHSNGKVIQMARWFPANNRTDRGYYGVCIGVWFIEWPDLDLWMPLPPLPRDEEKRE